MNFIINTIRHLLPRAFVLTEIEFLRDIPFGNKRLNAYTQAKRKHIRHKKTPPIKVRPSASRPGDYERVHTDFLMRRRKD